MCYSTAKIIPKIPVHCPEGVGFIPEQRSDVQKELISEMKQTAYIFFPYEMSRGILIFGKFGLFSLISDVNECL